MRAAALLLVIVPLLSPGPTTASPPDPESTYTVRGTIRILNPIAEHALNDEAQTARIVNKTETYTDIAFTLFPLLPEQPLTPNPNWRKEYAGMTEYLKPGVTSNWDPAMQSNLLVALHKDGIDPDTLDDVAVVKKVSRWLLDHSKYIPMFDTFYVDYPDGKPRIFPGLEKAFERDKGNPAWSTEQQLARELFGRSMFENRTHGSCTSSAIYWNTVFRALGIPTRIVLICPIVDPGDEKQVAMVKDNIHHHNVRQTILDGLPPGDSFSNHTLNEVFIGGRWARLNYNRIDQPILDRQCYGLTVHFNTLNDWSEGNYAATWGKRYGLHLHDEVSLTANPYHTLELSDHFGARAKIDNPPVTDPGRPKSATISRIYWLTKENCPDFGKPDPNQLMLHLDDKALDEGDHPMRTFLTAAPKVFQLRAEGHPTVEARTIAGSITSPSQDIREVFLDLPSAQREKMISGVEYELIPPKDENGYHWTTTRKLTITKSGASGEPTKVDPNAAPRKPLEPGSAVFHARDSVVSWTHINNAYRILFVEMKK
jgi:hypothetical protein